jgi:hypothetical protein
VGLYHPKDSKYWWASFQHKGKRFRWNLGVPIMGIYHRKDSDSWWGNFKLKGQKQEFFKLNTPYQGDETNKTLAMKEFEERKQRIIDAGDGGSETSHNYFGFKKNKKRLEGWLKRKYGIELKDYKELCKQQKFKCQICREFKTLCVDHCHHTGKIRGLLCRTCNSGIGLLKDNPAFLSNAIEYLNGVRVANA